MLDAREHIQVAARRRGRTSRGRKESLAGEEPSRGVLQGERGMTGGGGGGPRAPRRTADVCGERKGEVDEAREV